MSAPPPPATPSDARVPWRRDIVAWAVFALALLLRVAVVLDYEAHHPMAEHPVIDEASYERWALAIAGGDWLGDEVFFQEPLYPYWLGALYAIAGPERTFVRLVQAVVGALACVLVLVLARRTFGRVAGTVAGFALAVHTPHVFLSCLLLKENLFIPLWTALALLLVGRVRSSVHESDSTVSEREFRRAWLVGICGGLGALLRGNALVLLPALLLWPAVAHRFGWPNAPRAPWRSALFVLFGIGCVLGPTALRNWHVGGVAVLTTSGAGTNLYGGNNADNLYGRATEFDWVRGIPEHEAGDWKHEAERRSGRELDPAEVSSYWMGEVVQSVKSDPLLHAKILWNKARLTLGPYEVPDNHSLDWGARWVATLRFLPPGHILWGWLGLAGLCVFPFHAARMRVAWPLVWLWLGYFATVVLTVTSMRARMPLVVWLMPFAGLYVSQWLRPERRARHLAVAGVVAALVAWVPTLSSDERDKDLDGRQFNYAIQLLRSAVPQDRDEARAIAEELERRHPGSSRVLTLAAHLDAEHAFALLALHGNEARPQAEVLLDEALARLRAVVESEAANPRERFRANAVAGTIQLRLGRAAVAERRFREALDFDPTDPDLRLGLSDALMLRARALDAGSPERSALASEAARLLETLRAETDGVGLRAIDARLTALRELLTE